MCKSPKPERLSGSLVLVLALTLLGAGCDEPCRYDADCDTADGLTRCDVQSGVCGPLTPTMPESCSGNGDCGAGRVCVEGACHFTPSCQRVTQGVSFDYIVDCEGAIERGVATSNTNGCQVSFTLPDALGNDVTVALDPIPVTGESRVEITTSAGGPTTCLAGSWSAPSSAASLPSCQLPGGLTCDIGLVRSGMGPLCFSDGRGCDAPGTCEAYSGSDASAVGGCR